MKPIDQALAAHRAGNFAEAERLYRAILAKDARDFDALHMLGIIFAQRAQYVEAEKLIGNALAVDRKVVPCLHHYGNVLSMLGRFAEAIKIYDEALLSAPFYAPVYSDRGNAKRALGQLEDAVASYNRALSINPKFSDALGNLAQALIELRRFDEADGFLRRALALNANDPYATRLMGHLAFIRGDLDNALALSRRALELKPDQADAYHTIGNVLWQFGQLDAAREAHIKSVDLQPNNGTLYFGLALCKKFASGDLHLAKMASMAAGPARLSGEDRMYLNFALGKAYADIKDNRRSFEHLLTANSVKRAAISYDEAATFAYFDRIERTFTTELMAAKGGGDPSRRPIFIVGMPRSGTTLIEQLLASHPGVHGAGELAALSEVAQTVQVAGRPVRYPDYVPALDGPALQAVGANYLKLVTALSPDDRRITDKMPSNFYFLGLIHLTLPNAVIIHCVRDPVDTCVSCFANLFKFNEQHFAYDLGELGRYYNRYRRLMDHWRQVLPAGRVLDVRYETVIEDFEGEARRILAHCGLAWDDRCLSFHQTQRPVRTASAAQVREPLYKSAVGRGRAYSEFLGPLLGALDADAA